MATGPDEFLMAGDNLQISFTPTTPGPPIASVALQEAGRFENGKWGGHAPARRGRFGAALRFRQGRRGRISGSGVRLHLPVIQKSEIIQVQVKRRAEVWFLASVSSPALGRCSAASAAALGRKFPSGRLAKIVRRRIRIRRIDLGEIGRLCYFARAGTFRLIPVTTTLESR